MEQLIKNLQIFGMLLLVSFMVSITLAREQGPNHYTNITSKWPKDTQVEVSRGKFYRIDGCPFEAWISLHDYLIPQGVKIKVTKFQPPEMPVLSPDFNKWYEKLAATLQPKRLPRFKPNGLEAIKSLWPDDTEVEITPGNFLPITSGQFTTWLSGQENQVPIETKIRIKKPQSREITLGSPNFLDWYCQLKPKPAVVPKPEEVPTPAAPSGSPLIEIDNLIQQARKSLAQTLGDEDFLALSQKYRVDEVSAQPEQFLKDFLGTIQNDEEWQASPRRAITFLDFAKAIQFTIKQIRDHRTSKTSLDEEAEVKKVNKILREAWEKLDKKDYPSMENIGFPLYYIMLIWKGILASLNIQVCAEQPAGVGLKVGEGLKAQLGSLTSNLGSLAKLKRKV
jgi:hypothetical protein